MKTNMKRRIMSLMIAFLMVFTYVPAAAYATDNATDSAQTPAVTAVEGDATVMDGQIRITDDKATAVSDGAVVTITAAGVKTGKPTANNIKIYNDTDKAIILSFDYSAENYSAFSETDASGRFTAVIDPGESADMSITGIRKTTGNNTATLTLSNFEYTLVPETSEVTIEFDDAIGNITLDGQTVTNGSANSVSYASGGQLTASAVDGARFLGWIDPATGKIYSRETTYTVNPIENMTIEAVFMGENTEAYYLVGNEYLTDNFADAIAKTEIAESKTVVLMKDTTLTAGEYIIPAGVTFLVPFDDKETLYTKEPEATHATYETPKAYCTLTLGEGADLIVNGALSLSAKHFAANGGGRGSGAPTGNISYLVTEKDSTVTVNNGGALYAYGFIIGEGTVTAKEGATVYENFQIEDFRGGEVTMNIAYHEMEKGLLPISQYYVQNIEVPLTLEAGASEYVYTSLFANNQPYGAAVQFIGSQSAMFYLKEGKAVKNYDGTTDRLIFDIDGDMSLSPISVELAGTGIDSSMFEIPINSNISVNLNSGAVEISQDVSLLPGSEINIAEGTTCTLAEGINIFVYDLEQWDGYVGVNNVKFISTVYSPSKAYDRTEDDLKDAAIKVDGTFDASAGFIYTTTSEESTGGGANIYSTKNGVVKTATGVAPAVYQYVQNSGEGEFKLINMLPVNLKNADGSYVQTIETGVGAYTYTDGQWMCGHDIIKEVQIKAPTCTEYGEKEITCAMEDVQAGYGHVYTVKVDKLPHTEVIDKGYEATCTEPGLTDGSHCDVCKEVLVKQEPIDALGHAWGDEYVYDVAPTCTEKGSGTIRCEKCDAEKADSAQYIDPLGHSYKWEIKDPTCEKDGEKIGTCTRDNCNDTVVKTLPATGHDYVPVITEPTCEEGGYTTYTCSMCDDSYKADDTEKLGHIEVAAETKAATCTEDGHTAGKYCDRCKVTLEGMESIDALSHKMGEWIEDAAPTCTEKGKKHRDCERCDFVEETAVKATGHKEAIIDAVDATCTETGLTEGVYCDVCDTVLIEQEVVPVIDHKTVTDKEVKATCTETGLTEGSHCSVCGFVVAEQETVPALGHDYSETTVEPTCTADGYTEYTCGRCDDTYKDNIVKTEGHTLVTDKAVAPTCTETGLSEGSHCDVCGEIVVEQTVVEAAGHDLEQFDGKGATCTEKGHEPYEACNVCDYTTYKEIPVKDHVYKEHVVNATCTADGYTVKYCDCGFETTVAGEKATGHSFKEYVEVSAATCLKEGKEKAVCANGCGAVDVRDTAKGDHNLVSDEGTAATCTESGFTAGKYCSECEKWIEGHEVIPATNHADATSDAGKAATCTETGLTAGKYCPDCEKWIEGHEVIPATNHADAVADAGKAATCTESGFTAGRFCVACDKWIEGHEVIDAIGHQYGEEQYKAPTAEADGGTYEVCSECGNIHWIQTQTYKEYVKAGVNATTLKATATGSIKTETITVKWTNSSDFGITYYKVYRSTTGKDGSFSKVAEVTTKSYVDKKATVGKTYYYKVIGYREVAGSTYKTKISNIVSAKIKKVTAAQVKETPMYGRTNYVDRGLKVMWTSPNIKVDGYEIFRSTTGKAGSYKLIKTTKTTVKSWTNKGLKVGKRYYYKVRGYKLVNGKKVYTKFSSPGYRYVLAGRDAELASAIVRANAITAKSAVKVNNGIKVTWSKDANIKCNKYEVWRATSKNGTYTKIATTKNKYYTDTTAKKGKTYYYKVKGFRWFGKSRAETNYSNVVSGKR